MQSYWFCDSCKSMNRAEASRCYSCRAPKGSSLPEVHGHPHDVLIPGQTAPEDVRVVPALSGGSYLGALLLGYLSAILFIVPLLAGLVVLCGGVINILSALEPERFAMSATMERLTTMGLILYGAGLGLAVLFHSAFLCLTTSNVPALGGGMPRFGSTRAALWWIEGRLWVALASLIFGMLAAGALLAAAMFFPGLIVGVVAFWALSRLIGSPITLIRKPVRLHADLARRLGLQDSAGHGLVSTWATSWTIARLLEMLAPLLMALVMLLAAVGLFGQAVSGASQRDLLARAESLDRTVEASYVLFVAVAFAADLFALFAMTRLTLWYVHAQRARRAWILGGAKSRGATPPAARPPAPPAYAQQPPAYAQQPPAYAQQPPAYAQQPPAYAQQPPAYAQQPPAYAQQPPAARPPAPPAVPGDPAAEPKAPRILMPRSGFHVTGSAPTEPLPDADWARSRPDIPPDR
jgi:hypothetical protein